MTLSVSKLRSELRALLDPDDSEFVGWPGSASAAAANWTAAYSAYAEDAEDLSGDSPTVVFPILFQSVLLSYWNSYNTYTVGAQSLAEAWAAYWTGGVFAIGGLIAGTGSPCANVGTGNKIFGVETTSVVTVVNHSPLQSALLAEMMVPSINAGAKADAIADLLHAATTAQITVLITGLDTTPPPPGPQVVTNTCTVF